MATLSKRVADLEAWKLAHVGPNSNHVLSGHTHVHSHPLTAHEHPHTHEVVPEPPPVESPPPPSGTPIAVGAFEDAIRNAQSGQTLLLAPGTHPVSSTAILRLAAAGVTVTGQGATIKPSARPNGLFLTASGAVVRGLAFAANPGTYNDEAGSALLEVEGRLSRVFDTLVEDVRFDLPTGAAKVQHALYLYGDVERFTGRRLEFDAHGSLAAGFHAYHAPTSPAKDIVLEDCTFRGFDDAILYWLATVNLTIRNCDFIGTRSKDIRLSLKGGTARITNCRGSKGILVDGVASATTVIESGNDWSWTP